MEERREERPAGEGCEDGIGCLVNVIEESVGGGDFVGSGRSWMALGGGSEDMEDENVVAGLVVSTSASCTSPAPKTVSPEPWSWLWLLAWNAVETSSGMRCAVMIASAAEVK